MMRSTRSSDLQYAHHSDDLHWPNQQRRGSARRITTGRVLRRFRHSGYSDISQIATATRVPAV
jgi:hypothetical protein